MDPAPAIDALRAALSDRYDVERELGRGGMATVYLARDLRHDRRVAIKVLAPDLAAAIGRDRFHREVRIAAGLQHPHILPVFDSGDAGSLTWYAMPYVEGESLRDLLDRERTLPVERAIGVARQVADALDYAHGQGVVHRDIKPDNILLSRGHAMVADFGIARTAARDGTPALTATGLAIGTPAYMSPEQATAEHEVDGRTDVYSLGCVLYEMLVGEPPYTGPTPFAILTKRLTDPVPSPRRLRPELPREVDGAVMRALALDPADRFATPAALVDALTQRELVPSPVERPRNVRAFAAAGVLALVTVGVVGALVSRRPRGVEAEATPILSVIAFRNVGEAGDEYFAEGLTEEITARLARLPRLAVRRGARRGREESERAPSDVARDLGASYVLTGTVRWDRGANGSSRIRVTPRLIRVDDERELLGQTIDAALVNVFEVQSGIAEQVSTALGIALGTRDKLRLTSHPTAEIAAWDHFIRGNFHLAQRTPDAVRRAIEEYDAALAIDSAFTAALSRKAYGYIVFADWRWPYEGRSHAELLRLAAQLTERALARDSSAAESWLTRAFLHVVEDPFRLEGAVPAFERALAIDSTNGETWHQFGQSLMILGAHDQAVAAYRRALELEPERPMTLVPLAAIARMRGRLEEARHIADSAVAVVGVTSPYARVVRANMSLAAGDASAARADAEVALATDSSYSVPARSVLAAALASAGDTAGALREIGRARAAIDPRAPTSTDARFFAYALVALGRRAEALDVIERVRPRGALLWFSLSSPDFDPIRGDERFRRVYEDADPRERAPTR